MSTEQATKNCITLRGSAQIVTEYLKFGIHSILFQRGIYPVETFDNVQQYGLTILVNKDKKIQEFLDQVLSQVQEWLTKQLIHRISMIITNASTKEVLECWDFNIEAQLGDNGATTSEKLTSGKDLTRIQNEIRDVMRQIMATVSYLPLLEGSCSFDVKIYTHKNCEVPEMWSETEPVLIQNSQQVKLRTFSTGLHKVNTLVNYKLTE